MATKVEEGTKNYYILKSKYEKKYNTAIKNIRRSGLSLEQKKEKAKNIKIKCIGKKCSSTQGSIFTIKDNHLLANCGDIDNPCDLNIDIYRGNYLYLPTILKQVETDLENVKTTIVTLKLEILFALSNEETISEEFEKFKKKYLELEQIIANLNSIVIDNNMIEINQPIAGNDQQILKDEFIKLEMIKLGNLINEFRAIIKEAQLETSVSSIPFFSDAIQKYINKIIPLLKNIQTLKYDIQKIVEEGETFKLIQIKTSLYKNEVELESGKIISYNK
jgi:hypothetical protein